MELGELVTMYRKDKGLTIDELAELSNVPKGTLTKIITGVTKAPTLDNVKAIARALGKTLDDFDDEPKQKNPPDNSEGGKIKRKLIDAANTTMSDRDARILYNVYQVIIASGKENQE